MRAQVLLAGLAAGCGAAARAQSVTADSTITWTADWAEAPGGNHNGNLDPGESAIISLSVSFTHQNTVAHFSPPIGSFGAGTIRGLGSGFLDIHGTGGAQGEWNTDPNAGYGIDPLWDSAGHEGTPANGGADLLDLEFIQSYQPFSIVTTNPVVGIWRGLWTPAQYSPRSVTFQLAGNPVAGEFVSSVVLRLNSTMAAGVYVDPAHLNLGSVTIPIGIPAPPAAPLLLLPLWPRRGREGHYAAHPN